MYPLLVDTVNEHNLNGLDVKVTIPCLNSINKCVPQSFSCAWERQAKFAAASGPHQDVYDLHDVIMWYLSSDYTVYLVRHLFRLSDIATHLYRYEFDPVMDLYTQFSCLTSCTLRISPNRKPTSLMSSSMSSEIRTLDWVHPGHAMLRLPPSIRYFICRCISAMPSFWKHSSHCIWAASVSSSAHSSTASVAALVSCALSIAVCCIAIVSVWCDMIAYAARSLLMNVGAGDAPDCLSWVSCVSSMRRQHPRQHHIEIWWGFCHGNSEM